MTSISPVPTMTNIPIPTPITLVFKQVEGMDIKMDVYIPDTATMLYKAPVLLWWHGGGLLQGTRTALAPHLLLAPTKHNLTVISADYRLAPQLKLPEILSDCASALSYLSTPSFQEATGGRVDTRRVIVSGGSAGGWLSLLVGTGIGFGACGIEITQTIRNTVKGIVALYPITDITDDFWTKGQKPLRYLEDGRVIEREEVEPYIDPNDVKTCSADVDSRRSIFYHYMVQEGILQSLLLEGTGIPPSSFSISKNVASIPFPLPPIYIIHGTEDTKVPISQSREVVAALKELVESPDVEFHEMERLEHSFDKDPRYDMASLYEFVFNLVKGMDAKSPVL